MVVFCRYHFQRKYSGLKFVELSVTRMSVWKACSFLASLRPSVCLLPNSVSMPLPQIFILFYITHTIRAFCSSESLPLTKDIGALLLISTIFLTNVKRFFSLS